MGQKPGQMAGIVVDDDSDQNRAWLSSSPTSGYVGSVPPRNNEGQGESVRLLPSWQGGPYEVRVHYPAHPTARQRVVVIHSRRDKEIRVNQKQTARKALPWAPSASPPHEWLGGNRNDSGNARIAMR